MPTLILTIVGPDRPGLVRTLSEALAARGGNWLESRMARLGGQFAGIVMVDAPDSFPADLAGLEAEGFRITVAAAGGGAAVVGPLLVVEVTGNDRPGIVHEVTRVLAAHGANIEDMTTNVSSGAFSGEALFRAAIVLRAPDEKAVAALTAGLERISNDIMVDVRPAEG
ncbi:MAG TPA: ACT domain-containing protein [Acetobacteraceae bacterium]|nr:ACT domain-containing protein [Acetobacteraceae bacterium]